MRRWWWYRPGQWSGLLPSKESDEYGRHTLVLPTLLFGTFVIAGKACDCEDMTEFRCVNGCPWLAMSPGNACWICEPWDEADQ